MNQPEPVPGELSRLIARLSDGSLTPEEAERLNHLLHADPAAQEAYLDHLAVDGLLEREFGGASAELPARAAAKSGGQVIVRGPWRKFAGWGQLAAGLVIGAFLASAVWAYALPLLSSALTRFVPLANSDFESGEFPPPAGVPTRAGIWSGDYVTIAGPEGMISPYSGLHMLRFLRADNERASSAAAVRASELWQVLDLKSLRPSLGNRTLLLQLGARFNAAAQPGRRYTCGVALVALRGQAAEAPLLWPRRHEAALAESQREERLDDDPATWQRVETQVAVPPDADLLLAQIRIYDKTAAAADGPSVFPAHYADDVSLRVLNAADPLAERIR